MGIDSEFDVARGVVITRASGVVTIDDLRAHQVAIREDPRFDPSFDHVFDLCGATGFDLDAEEIRQLAGVRVFSDASRRAAVAPRDVDFGRVQMYRAYGEVFGNLSDNSLGVFRTLEEALRWLDESREVSG